MTGWAALSQRARWLFHIQALVALFTFHVPVLLGLSFLAYRQLGLNAETSFAVLAGLLLLRTAWSAWWPSVAWSRWAWWLREDDLLVSHGVIVKSLEAVPRARVQHVDLQQGLWARMFGVVDLRVSTASGGVVIPGLDMDVALWLRDALVDVRGDDGV